MNRHFFKLFAKLGRALCVAMLFAGCAHEEADFPSQDELYAQPYLPNDFVLTTSSGDVVNARISQDGLIGPRVNLSFSREDGAISLRGLAFGAAVFAEVSPTQVSGLWGPEPLRLTVTRLERRLHIEGTLRGRLVDLWVDSDAITGSIGPTGYDLHRKDKQFEGSRNAGKAIELVSVQMPERWSALGDGERAAIVTILLSA